MKLIFKYLFILISINLYCQDTTTIFEIAKHGKVEELEKIVNNDKSLLNSINNNGNSLLILACYYGNKEVADYLIKNKTDLNYVAVMGTALMAAVVVKNKDIVQNLLENGANPDLSDKNGTTALIYATIFKQYEIINLLIAFKANIELKDNKGKTAFDYAIDINDDKLIKIIKTKT